MIEVPLYTASQITTARLVEGVGVLYRAVCCTVRGCDAVYCRGCRSSTSKAELQYTASQLCVVL